MNVMKSVMLRYVAAIGIALGAVLWQPASAWACPNCKQTLADDEARQDNANQGLAAAAGYNYSIFLMLGTLYLTVGSFIGGGIYYLRKHSTNINRT